MKTKKVMFIAVMLVAVMLSSTQAFSQTTNKEIKTLKLLTNAHCNACKKTLEEGLAYEKGIKDASLDLNTKVLTVAYNPQKTDEQIIKAKVQKLGYTAETYSNTGTSGGQTGKCCAKPCTKSCAGHGQGCGKH